MSTGDFISDQKISAAHLAILFAFLVSIVSKESIPQSLNVAAMSIGASVPFLALSTILFQLVKATASKSLHRTYYICFGVGHILGVFSLTCIFYSLSAIAGITFLLVSLCLAAVVGPALDKADPTKGHENGESG